MVDLGANRGQFSKELSDRAGGSFYLFEANPKLVEDIVVGRNMTVTHAAIAATDGEIVFNVAKNHEGSSILKLPDVSDYDCVLDSVVSVPSITLDRALSMVDGKYIDVLKVDIEGAEVVAFAGADLAALSNRVAQICVEFHTDREFGFDIEQDAVVAIGRLRSAGFMALDFSQNRTDVLFLNTELLALGRARYRMYQLWAKYGYPCVLQPRTVRGRAENVLARLRRSIRRRRP